MTDDLGLRLEQLEDMVFSLMHRAGRSPGKTVPLLEELTDMTAFAGPSGADFLKAQADVNAAHRAHHEAPDYEPGWYICTDAAGSRRCFWWDDGCWYVAEGNTRCASQDLRGLHTKPLVTGEELEKAQKSLARVEVLYEAVCRQRAKLRRCFKEEKQRTEAAEAELAKARNEVALERGRFIELDRLHTALQDRCKEEARAAVYAAFSAILGWLEDEGMVDMETQMPWSSEEWFNIYWADRQKGE